MEVRLVVDHLSEQVSQPVSCILAVNGQVCQALAKGQINLIGNYCNEAKSDAQDSSSLQEGVNLYSFDSWRPVQFAKRN